tara:strand:- start:445 stop:546 length:102 start_codon:yes stop_codon:yes gene_type:complete
MIINVLIGMLILALFVGMMYGLYMAIWGVYEEY